MNDENLDSKKSTKSDKEVGQQTLVMKGSSREKEQPKLYSPLEFHSNFSLSAIEYDPRSIKEAINLTKGELWKKAMKEEMASLRENETWDLVMLPYRWKPINSMWVFKKKMNVVGQVERYKARLVAKGYSQVEGVDFCEIFSHVAKLNYIRVLMYLAIDFDIEIE